MKYSFDSEDAIIERAREIIAERRKVLKAVAYEIERDDPKMKLINDCLTSIFDEGISIDGMSTQDVYERYMGICMGVNEEPISKIEFVRIVNSICGTMIKVAKQYGKSVRLFVK